MRAVVDRLQGPAPEPPGRVALGGGVRLGAGAARRRPPVPDVAQPLTGVSGPEGDQFQTSDVTGESSTVFTLTHQVQCIFRPRLKSVAHFQMHRSAFWPLRCS